MGLLLSTNITIGYLTAKVFILWGLNLRRYSNSSYHIAFLYRHTEEMEKGNR
jgi:hypothetical protein